MATNSKETQARITTAAKILFSTYGYKETKILDIAKAANVSLSTIYANYTNKKMLFDSLGMPEMESVRPEFEKKREEVLKKALILFGEKGYCGTTMDDIASSLGFSKASIYQYCSSKEDLFSQVLQESALNTNTVSLKRSYFKKNWEDAILDIGMSYLKIGHDSERIALLRSVLRDSNQFPEIGKLFYERGFKEAATNIMNYLNDVAAEGLIRSVNLEMAVNSYLGTLLAYIILHYVISGAPATSSDEAYVKQVTDIFINGLKAKPY